jgi:sulfur-oxidizing protein SoxY
MNQSRRQVMQLGAGATVAGLAATAGLLPSVAQAADAPGWDPKLFEAHTLDEIAKGMGCTASASSEVSIIGPDIAENGAVVPVGIKSTASGVTMLGIVVEKNPTALVATFKMGEGAVPSVATRIKMAKTADVYAVARVGDKLLYSKKEIKVTLGGCGG